MNFVKDKRRMALFGLIIASVAIVHHVKASPSADSKQNGKEYPASRDDGNKSKCPVIDSSIIDTELERGKNERQTENRILLTYCLVTSCLLLEVLICVVLQLCLRKKCSQTRPERQDAENTPPTATNPIYQPGLQRPCISNPLAITHQGPYQSLIVNTSERGASAEYRALEGGHRDNHLIGDPVDFTDYQDLDQTNPRHKYKSLLIVGSFSENREWIKDCRHSDEPNIQKTLKETDAKPGTDDQMHRVIEELETTVSMRALDSHDAGEPLYYVLEGPLPSPEPDGDSMHCVVKELESLNKNGPKRASSDDFTTEPLYSVLESPEDTEDKGSKEETNK